MGDVSSRITLRTTRSVKDLQLPGWLYYRGERVCNTDSDGEEKYGSDGCVGEQKIRFCSEEAVNLEPLGICEAYGRCKLKVQTMTFFDIRDSFKKLSIVVPEAAVRSSYKAFYPALGEIDFSMAGYLVDFTGRLPVFGRDSFLKTWIKSLNLKMTYLLLQDVSQGCQVIT